MENLGIDYKLLIAQLVNFGIFFFVFYRFISTPLLKYLKKQKEEEELRAKMAAELEERQAKLEAKDKEYDKKRKAELEKALTQAKKDAAAVREEIIEEARKDAASIITKAQEQIVEEKAQLYKDVRKQVAAVSTLVVERALREYLTEDAQRKVTQNIIKHIPEEATLEN